MIRIRISYKVRPSRTLCAFGRRFLLCTHLTLLASTSNRL